MSRGWKIFWWVIGIIGALILIVAVILICAIFWMQTIAKEVYGGNLAPNVAPIVGFNVPPNKLGVFMERDNNVVAVIIKQSTPSNSATPFSEPDAKKALHSFDKTHQLDSIFEGADTGTEKTFKLGNQTVHAVEYSTTASQKNWGGVLNLEKSKLVFMANVTSKDPSADTSVAVANFLSKMPVVKNDPRMK